VRGIDRALAAALERPGRLGEKRYLVVRYEELVHSTEPELRRIADFLGIGWDDVLLRPTLAGRQMRANSAWLDRRTVGEVHALSLGEPGAGLDRRVLRSVLATTGANARALGYELPPLRRGLFGRRRESVGRAASPPPRAEP
jgi:Sulfotransferase family